MKNKLFSGIMPALITTVNEDNTLKRDVAEEVMRRELKTGITGFYINGATGEGPLLPEKTRMEMAELAVDVCRGRGAVINHVGAADMASALRLAKHARETGCDAVASVVPNFFFKFKEECVLDYYRRLAAAAELPVLVYVQGLMTDDPYAFMQKAITIDGVIGCKFTNFNFYAMHRITKLNGGDINVINGPDEMLICGLTMGADGGIGSTYNVIPAWYCALYEAFRKGDFAAARDWQYKIDRVVEILLADGSCIASVKAYFSLLGIDAGFAALPQLRLDAAQMKTLHDRLAAEGVEVG